MGTVLKNRLEQILFIVFFIIFIFCDIWNFVPVFDNHWLFNFLNSLDKYDFLMIVCGSLYPVILKKIYKIGFFWRPLLKLVFIYSVPKAVSVLILKVVLLIKVGQRDLLGDIEYFGTEFYYPLIFLVIFYIIGYLFAKFLIKGDKADGLKNNVNI